MANVTVMHERELDEYARLYQQDGRVSAVQDYVDNEMYIDADLVLRILGIDMTKHNAIWQTVEKKGEKHDEKIYIHL